MEPEKVFVSSTCHDLIDLRAELREHLREMGLIPILSDADDFKVEPDVDSIETCLVNLRASDIVLTVVAARYGRPLGGKYGDISATHLEYRTAVELGKPRHFFVRDTTLGALEAWKTAPSKAGEFRPVAEKDVPHLFPWLEEQRKLGSPGSNWIHPFTSSVDLRRRVSVQLEREAERAFIRRGVAEGRIPVLALWVTRSATVRKPTKPNQPAPKSRISLSVHVKNPSTVPVFEVTVSESSSGFGVLDPLEEREFMIGREIDGSPLNLSFRVEYDTIRGERLAIDVECSAEKPPRVLSRRIRLVSATRFDVGADRPAEAT
jgi:hypothetical protein